MTNISEKDKMLLGADFYYDDKELVNDIKKASKLLNEFNNIKNNDIKINIGKKIFGKYGINCNIKTNFQCTFGYNIYLEDSIDINFNCVFIDAGKIKIGKNALIGPGVHIYTVGHHMCKDKRKNKMAYAKNVIIGDNCWIGGMVVICPGVTIGDNVIIGTGSVVTKNIPDNSIVSGNPSKIINSSSKI